MFLFYSIYYDDTSKIKTYVGSDGKLHFINKAGADTVLNFNKGIEKIANFSNTNTLATNLSKGFYLVHLTKANTMLYGGITIQQPESNLFPNNLTLSKQPNGNYFAAGETLNIWMGLYGSGNLLCPSNTSLSPNYTNKVSGEVYTVNTNI